MCLFIVNSFIIGNVCWNGNVPETRKFHTFLAAYREKRSTKRIDFEKLAHSFSLFIFLYFERFRLCFWNLLGVDLYRRTSIFELTDNHLLQVFSVDKNQKFFFFLNWLKMFLHLMICILLRLQILTLILDFILTTLFFFFKWSFLIWYIYVEHHFVQLFGMIEIILNIATSV